MKRASNGDVEKLHIMLENLELPEVKMPAHQRHLKEILLASGCFKSEGAHLSVPQEINGGIKMKTKAPTTWVPWRWRLVGSLATMALVLGVYAAFFTAPQAVASLALQVNPAVTLTLSERNTVIDAEGLDAHGESLLAGLDVTGKQMPEALRLIAEALRETGLLEDGRRVLIALHPVGGRLGEAELTALTGTVRQAFDGYVAEHSLPVDVVSVSLTADLAAAVLASGLLPADYVDLVTAVGSPIAMRVLNLQKELGLDPALFKEEFGTIAAALIDMKDAGIAGDDALAILKGTLIADPKLEELTTITAALIDLHEAGATQEDIMSVFTLLEEQVVAGIERSLLLEEITTITAAKIDLLDAGVPAATALAVLRTALAADPKLEELTTITAAMIDLIEEGLSKDEALARVQAAIKADPTLQNFDDLIDASKNEEEENEAQGTGRPQPPRPRPVKPEPDKPEAEAPGEGAVKPDEPEAEAPGEDSVKPPQGPADAPNNGAGGEN
jgi:hypothetical protein